MTNARLFSRIGRMALMAMLATMAMLWVLLDLTPAWGLQKYWIPATLSILAFAGLCLGVFLGVEILANHARYKQSQS